MQNVNHTIQNLYNNLSPALLTRISQNNTLETLILTGDVDFGFLAGQNELFSDIVLGAFQKNNSVKTLVFEKLSLQSIQFLIPALGKIERLILRNIGPDDIQFLCNCLSKVLPISPELILEQSIHDEACHAAVNQYNQKRVSLLQVISSRKRDFSTSKINENLPPSKRICTNTNKESDTGTVPESDMEVDVVNLQAIQLALLQNPELFSNFMQYVHQENTKPQNSNSPQSVALRAKHLDSFNKIRQGYLECAPLFQNQPIADIAKGRKATRATRFEFCELAKKANCEEFKKFIPMLVKKAKSPIFDLRESAVILAAEHGNRETLNQLLGGRIRMIVGEPSAENIEAVLSEREILVIKRDANIALKTANLAFKNNKGHYQEEPISLIKIPGYLFKSQTLCDDVTLVTRLIKMLNNLNSSPIFLRQAHHIVPSTVLEQAFIAALQNGHLSILYDLIDYINQDNKLDYFKPSVTDDNCFSNFTNYLACFAIKNGYTPLLNLLLQEVQGLHEQRLIKTAIIYNKPHILNCLLKSYYFSDEQIQSSFQFALHLKNSIEIQHYFLNQENNLFYSIAAKTQAYEIKVIKNRTEQPLILEHIEHDSLIPLYLFIDDGYSLGLVSSDQYKEYKITNEQHLSFIQKILSEHTESTVFQTSDWSTRHFRLLLLSLGVSVTHQFDPETLARLINFTPDDSDSTNEWNDDNIMDVFMSGAGDYPHHKMFDLSLNDNQLLKCLAQLYKDAPAYTTQLAEQKNKLGRIIIELLHDVRINPLCPTNSMNYYDRSIKLSIEQGYEDVLPILTKSNPNCLSQMFLNFPKEMEHALHAMMKKNRPMILETITASLRFAKLEPNESTELENRRLQNNAIQKQLNDLKNQSHCYTLDYIKSETDRLDNEWQSNNKIVEPIVEKYKQCMNTNQNILKVLLSSPLVFKSLEPIIWRNYFTTLGRTYPIPDTLIDYVMGWPKMKVWREAKYQLGFFPKNEAATKIDVPNEIFDLIEQQFLNVHQKNI